MNMAGIVQWRIQLCYQKQDCRMVICEAAQMRVPKSEVSEQEK